MAGICRVENLKHVTIYLFIAILFLVGGFANPVWAQRPDKQSAAERRAIKGKIYSDTLLVSDQYERQLGESDKLYDTLLKGKTWFGRMFAPILITSPRNATDEAKPATQLEISRLYFSEFSGCTISAINIVQANVFTRSPDQKLSWAERFVDAMHKQTSVKVLRRNLLFEVGDTISPYRMSVAEELLRSLPYVAASYIVVNRSKFNPSQVSISVFVRDSWTISADLSWGQGGQYYTDVFDRNFLGTGNELLLRYYMPIKGQGNAFEGQYNINNLFGTFTNVNLAAGVGSTNNRISIEASRPFILPSDHIWGLAAGYRQFNQGLGIIDTMLNVKESRYALWYGYSWLLDRNQGTALYAMLCSSYLQFDQRPDVSLKLNPSFHNNFNTLLSVGVSRQNYFQGNMIYGYGRTEDIPFGFKFEAVGGYQWSEFLGRRLYGGVSALWGNAVGSSYLNLGAKAGGYWTRSRKWEQVMIDVSARYFSPLFKLGDIYMRQFVTASATWGINRLEGERESISYNSFATVRGMGVSNERLGYNRATLSAETVLFTPLFFYHFRFAFYLWGDVGVLGYNPVMFKNPLSSVVGIGVRIKNERLIFNNIQLRLGFAIRQPEGYNFEMFSLSNESVLNLNSFKPQITQPIGYE